jgi:hypothetical protein
MIQLIAFIIIWVGLIYFTYGELQESKKENLLGVKTIGEQCHE